MVHCIKDILEISYYVAFIILTYKIVIYARRTYELEASRQYDLLCQFSIMEETTGDYIFGYALEIYNAGNKVAKNVEVLSGEKHITKIDFVKPGSSAFYPMGNIMRMLGENRVSPDTEIALEKGKPVSIYLVVDGKKLEYNLNTDILFATRDNVTGTLKGIEDKLAGIEKAIDTEYQRSIHGSSLVHIK